MSDLRALYQELIIDHGRYPRNFRKMNDASVSKEGFNPLCGDRLILFLKISNDKIMDVSFEGSGCAISMASTSLMTESLTGKNISEAKKIFHVFHDLITGKIKANEEIALGKLLVLKGVCEFPSRVKCATLAWHTMIATVEHKDGNISTE